MPSAEQGCAWALSSAHRNVAPAAATVYRKFADRLDVTCAGFSVIVGAGGPAMSRSDGPHRAKSNSDAMSNSPIISIAPVSVVEFRESMRTRPRRRRTFEGGPNGRPRNVHAFVAEKLRSEDAL